MAGSAALVCWELTLKAARTCKVKQIELEKTNDLFRHTTRQIHDEQGSLELLVCLILGLTWEVTDSQTQQVPRKRIFDSGIAKGSHFQALIPIPSHQRQVNPFAAFLIILQQQQRQQATTKMTFNTSDVCGLLITFLFPRLPFVTGDVLDDVIASALRDLFVCGKEIVIQDFNITQMSTYMI